MTRMKSAERAIDGPSFRKLTALLKEFRSAHHRPPQGVEELKGWLAQRKGRQAVDPAVLAQLKRLTTGEGMQAFKVSTRARGHNGGRVVAVTGAARARRPSRVVSVSRPVSAARRPR